MQDTLDKILSAIDNGFTVYITNHLRSFYINKKVLTRFERKGYDLFKATDNNLLMLSGKKYVDIKYCKITYK